MITFFRADKLRRISTGGGDGNERIMVHEVPVRSCEKWLEERASAGLLIDPKVYAGLFFALHYRIALEKLKC